MPHFTYRIEMVTRDDDADVQGWDLLEKIRRATNRSPMQTNFVVFEKDGKQYPESKEALERSQAHERSRQKQEAADRVREARYNLGEAEKQLASLEEPDGTAT